MYRNIAKMSTATSGTGTITLGSAVSGFLSFANAGFVDSELVTFIIEDGSNREVSQGKYTVSGTTLTRDIVLASTNGGSKISLSGTATVFVGLAAEDVVNIGAEGYLLIADEFIAASSESGEIGQLNWVLSTAAVTLGAAEVNHPGVIDNSYTGTSTSARMDLGAIQIACGSIDEIVYIVKLSFTAAATLNMAFGLMNAGGISSFSEGVVISRLAADTDWWGEVWNTGSKTRTSNALLTDAAANNTWHKFKIRRISSTSWGFSVDNGTEEVISAGNYPDDTDMVLPTFAQYNSSGTTVHRFYIDYFHIRVKPMTRF